MWSATWPSLASLAVSLAACSSGASDNPTVADTSDTVADASEPTLVDNRAPHNDRSNGHCRTRNRHR